MGAIIGATAMPHLLINSLRLFLFARGIERKYRKPAGGGLRNWSDSPVFLRPGAKKCAQKNTRLAQKNRHNGESPEKQARLRLLATKRGGKYTYVQ
jgi:hypothetical protein